jgi:hypothetical protein
VSALKNDQSLKTRIEENTELRLSIWHSRTHEAFLMHVESAMDTIKKHRQFKAYEEAHEAYVEQCNLVKQARATLAEFGGTTSKGAGTFKKSSKKHKEVTAMADTSEPNLQANFQLTSRRPNKPQRMPGPRQNQLLRTCSSSRQTCFLWMLSMHGKKIIQEQMQSNPYTNLQGIFKKGPRGPLRKPFDDWVMFHLLIVFPNNAAKQERYYLTTVLKKPQHVSERQFMQRVEQLNSYIAQLPCWFYSPSVQPIMILANVLFTKADLTSHVLQMCPHMWQDQFNLHKKGMTPMDMCLLCMSLEAIEHICKQ